MRAMICCLTAAMLAAAPAATARQSGAMYRRAGVISGNRTSTAFGNWGVIGQPCTVGPRGSWMYPTNGYIGDMSILVGVELPIRDYNNDGIPDTIHSVVTCPVARPTTMPDVDPVTGKYWTFEPVAGFFNSSDTRPAISTDPATWPSSWPDHPTWASGVWNGLFGPDSFVGSEETFFRMDDRNDERMYKTYGFLPDPPDTTIRGQGIQVDSRYLQLADPLFQDVIIRIFDIKNTGKVSYAKVVFGNLTGTYVGVTDCDDRPQEYNNDAAVFFSSNDFIMTGNYPENQMKNPLWQGRVGKFGEAFLDSPGDTIASYAYFTPANNLPMGNDQQLWTMLKPGSYSHPSSVINDTVVLGGEDGDYIYGSNYFSLDTGETRRIASVISYGDSKDQVLQHILLAKALYNSNFDTAAMKNALTITNLSSHRTLAGLEAIQWTSPQGGGSVDLWFSPDAGQSWKAIAKYAPNTGSFDWNTAAYPDCYFGVLRVYIRDSAGKIHGVAQSPSTFSVSNGVAPAPFVAILNQLFRGDTLTGRTLPLQLLIGDPHSPSLTTNVYYRVTPASDYVLCDAFTASSDTNPQVHTINLWALPNSDEFSVKVEVSSGGTISGDSTEPFHKLTPRESVPPSHVQVLSGHAQVPVEFRIVDSSKVKPDAYIITFDDTSSWIQKSFSVFNQTSGSYVLRAVPFSPNIEAVPFDGIALYTEDKLTQNDPGLTHWNPPIDSLRSFSFAALNVWFGFGDTVFGYRQPHDYMIAYHDQVVDTSVAVDSFWVTSVPIKFTVVDRTTGGRLRVLYVAYPPSYDVVFIEDVAGRMRFTWDLSLLFASSTAMPGEGDTLFLYTEKGLSFTDSLKLSGFTLGVDEGENVPMSFRLSQNYPNPFNPTTALRYDLPENSRVVIKIFDMLGREVRTLVDATRPAGSYSVVWDGTNSHGSAISSGVYFCRVEITGLSSRKSFTAVRKMALVR